MRATIVLWHSATTMGCNADTCPIGSSFVPPAAIAAVDTAPSGCPCDHKGKRPKGGFSGGSVHSPVDRPTVSFSPPLPPSTGRETKRPVATPPPSNGRTPPPSDKGTPSFTPMPPPSLPPPAKQSNGKGNRLTPPVIIDVAPLPSPPVSLPPPAKQTNVTDSGKQAPVPFVNTVPLGSVGMEPNPFAPYCGPDNELTPASALCRAAGSAGLSPECQQMLLTFLRSGSKQTLGEWIATNELCDQAALRRAVGIAEASMAAKASAGLYDKPGFGNPFGVDGYAWSQDRIVKPSPYVKGGNGATMEWNQPPKSTVTFGNGGVGKSDPKTGYAPSTQESPNSKGYFTDDQGNPLLPPRRNVFMGMKDDSRAMAYRAPSGGMPNYYRPTGDAFSDALAQVNGMSTAEVNATLGSDGSTDLSGESSLDRAAKGQLTAAQTADSFARGRDNPPTNYAAIIGSVGTAVGGLLGGINQAVDQAENRRLRELEINYANNARGAQLALQTRQAELAGEIARLRSAPTATTDPATAAMIQRLEQQGEEYRTSIQRMEAAAASNQGMSTGTTVALVGGGLVVAGGIAYLVLGNKRGRR